MSYQSSETSRISATSSQESLQMKILRDVSYPLIVYEFSVFFWNFNFPKTFMKSVLVFWKCFEPFQTTRVFLKFSEFSFNLNVRFLNAYWWLLTRTLLQSCVNIWKQHIRSRKQKILHQMTNINTNRIAFAFYSAKAFRITPRQDI